MSSYQFPDKSSKWGQISSSFLDFVFQNLSFKDVVEAGAVNSHWFSVARTLLNFKCSQDLSNQIPKVLHLPPSEEEDDDDDHGDANADIGFRFYDLKTKTFGDFVSDLSNGNSFSMSCCIGCSHGWLIFIDQIKVQPVLFNPSLQIRIQLPRLDSILNIEKFKRKIDGTYIIEYDNGMHNMTYFLSHLCNNFLRKAILSSDPCLDSVNRSSFIVVIIYDYNSKLAFCKYGDSCWTYIDGKNQEVVDLLSGRQQYQDILYHKNHLYALYKNWCIDVWYFDESYKAVKKTECNLSCPEKSWARWTGFENIYAIKYYLVETTREILLVERFVGDSNDEATYEDENFDANISLRTMLFLVYRLDFEAREWVLVEDLGDQTLFLGGYHSILVSKKDECEKNSIYFLDDFWEATEDDEVGGYDIGIYRLTDQTTKPICKYDSELIQSSPCWLSPNPYAW